MKVLHVCTVDRGGAYKAAVRISYAMETQGIESSLLLRVKTNKVNLGEQAINNPVTLIISKIKNLLNILMSSKNMRSGFLGIDISRNPLVLEADIIFLHWINAFISFKCLKKLKKMGKPVVWVMHDMWLFTGGCHYDRYCGKYKVCCTECPNAKNRIHQFFITKHFNEKKNVVLSDCLKMVIGPSNWIVDCADKSIILNKVPKVCIHNPIDTNVYHHIPDKSALRDKYGISKQKKVILFGAENALNSSIKGGKYLLDVAKNLSSNEYMIVVFGNEQDEKLRNVNLDIKYLGYIADEKDLVEIYNLADVFVAPSEQENYANTVLEALACGLPVVAFPVGGMVDIINHMENGYIASFEDKKNLIRGIEWCVKFAESRDIIARRIEMNNGYGTIGSIYASTCKELLGLR